ncbi:MAG: hypothetical protein D6718_03035 [Acidobacteria bacterium]|nr:MAG: hypothetical protein D6718_03035 [Acidobacteriota bacterium]
MQEQPAGHFRVRLAGGPVHRSFDLVVLRPHHRQRPGRPHGGLEGGEEVIVLDPRVRQERRREKLGERPRGAGIGAQPRFDPVEQRVESPVFAQQRVGDLHGVSPAPAREGERPPIILGPGAGVKRRGRPQRAGAGPPPRVPGACRVVWWRSRGPGADRRRPVRSAFLALVLVAAPVAGAAPARPNVLLVTVDTLRADHCSFNGYAVRTTPNLERLARRGTVFAATYSASSWTPPAMASLFTSLPPHAHGVVNGTVRHHRLVEQDRLAPELRTLAEAFAAAGYATAGVSTNIHLSPQTGFAQGFERFERRYWAPAEEATEAALELARQLGRDRPLFLWVHYMDPHDPYRARSPWIDRFAAGLRVADWAGRPLTELRGDPRLRRDESERRALVALYDSEIAAVDAAVGELVRGLGAAGDWVIAFTADHGESLLERGMMGHGNGLYEQEVRIPLLLLIPGTATVRRVDRPVSLLDVGPTLLEAAGVGVPAASAGRSLLPLARGEKPAAVPVVMEIARRRLVAHAVRDGEFKLYVSSSPVRFTSLFDLRTDPEETRSVLAEHAATAARLRAVWAAWMKRWPARKAEKVRGRMEEGDFERLRSLGYLD